MSFSRGIRPGYAPVDRGIPEKSTGLSSQPGSPIPPANFGWPASSSSPTLPQNLRAFGTIPLRHVFCESLSRHDVWTRNHPGHNPSPQASSCVNPFRLPSRPEMRPYSSTSAPSLPATTRRYNPVPAPRSQHPGGSCPRCPTNIHRQPQARRPHILHTVPRPSKLTSSLSKARLPFPSLPKAPTLSERQRRSATCPTMSSHALPINLTMLKRPLSAWMGWPSRRVGLSTPPRGPRPRPPPRNRPLSWGRLRTSNMPMVGVKRLGGCGLGREMEPRPGGKCVVTKWCKARNGAGNFVCLNAVNGGSVIYGGKFCFMLPCRFVLTREDSRVGSGMGTQAQPLARCGVACPRLGMWIEVCSHIVLIKQTPPSWALPRFALLPSVFLF